MVETLQNLVEALVHASARETPPGEAEIQENIVAQRLAEITCYALDCQRVCIFSFDQVTEESVLLVVVAGFPAGCQEASSGQLELLRAWLDGERLACLRRGEMVLVEPVAPLFANGSLPPERLRVLVVPVQGD